MYLLAFHPLLTKPFILLMVLLFSLCISMSANAIQKKDNENLSALQQHAFAYVGAKLSVNHYQNACQSWAIDCDATDIAGGFYAGYQFNKYFALEAAYLNLGKVDAIYPINEAEKNFTGSMQGIEISALALYPLSNDFNAFAKAGVFNWQAKSEGGPLTQKDYGLSPTIGLGLSYQISKQWQARLEYQYFANIGSAEIGGANAHLSSLGISYQFKHEKRILSKPAPLEIVYLETIQSRILFDFAQTDLLLEHDLDIAITRLTTYKKATVVLTGYTDNTGKETFNLQLSKQRVQSIKKTLLDRGVQASQITEVYKGESDPIIGNDSREHRHLNRRVDILLPALNSNQ